MKKKPLFFAWTRSFWSAVMTAILLVHDTGEPLVRAIASLVAAVVGGDVEQMTSLGMTLLPLATLFYALQQRSGAARPYTIDPRAIE